MKLEESQKEYRFFGIEFRIFFSLISFIFLLVAAVGFKNSLGRGIGFLALCAFTAFVIWLDYFYHLVRLTSSELFFQKIVWRKLASWKIRIGWNEIKKVTTSTYGFFDILKSTKIEGKNNEFFVVFSFMEDYLHFLKDVTREAKSARIDKLTLDLLAGRADL
jgi:hypothetical protein